MASVKIYQGDGDAKAAAISLYNNFNKAIGLTSDLKA